MKVVRLFVAAIVAALVVLVAVLVPLALADDEDHGRIAAVMGPANGVDDPDSGVESANLSSVRTYSHPGALHDSGEITYDQQPPVGGTHDPIWLECGVYERPVREENMVHALEHGTVWITYRSDLGDDDVAALAEALPDEGVLSPYEEQEDPVVVTVWDAQLGLSGADDPRLGLFLDSYGNGETAPEPMASCHGGTEAYETEGSSV